MLDAFDIFQLLYKKIGLYVQNIIMLYMKNVKKSINFFCIIHKLLIRISIKY